MIRAAWAESIEQVPTNVFAFVMASGITSTALSIRGLTVLSAVLLAIALIGFVVLVVVVLLHVVRCPSKVVRDLQDPRTSFGHFTIVAASGVLAARLVMSDASQAAVPLAVAAVLLWLVLTYGLPAVLMLQPHDDSVARDIDGSWFLWVVGTQSVSIVVAVVDLGLGDAAATIAIALWAVGVLLYLMLATLVVLRLLSVSNSPENMAPSYWIFTGATAVSVLAASQILALPAGSPALEATESFVSGTAFALWAFGTWWIPLLLVFGTWRYAVKRYSFRYEGGLWSVVFPLGMYATASMQIGKALDLPIVEAAGKGMTFVAAVAWAGVSVLMVAAWTRSSAGADRTHVP